MIWIFNREDRLTVLCSNDLPEGLPILSANMHEVLNGDINLDFEVPLDHPKAALIEEGYSAAVQRENGTWELFLISEIQQEKSTDDILFVSCRHAVQELAGEYIINRQYDRKEASTVLPDLLGGTRWTAGIVENTAIHDLTLEKTTILEGLKKFIERWEGEVSYKFDISSAGIVNRIINFSQRIGQDAGRRFEWGRDLEALSRTVNEEGIKTALIGIGRKEAAPDVEGATEEDLYFTDVDQYTGNENIIGLGLDTVENYTAAITKSSGIAAAAISAERARSGSQSIRVETTTGTGYVFFGASTVGYNHTFEVGQRYIFSVYAYSLQNASISFRLRYNDTSYAPHIAISHVGAAEWKRYSFEFTAAKESGIFSFWDSSAGNVFFLDEFMLERADAGQTDPTEWKPTGSTIGAFSKPQGQLYVEDPAAKAKWGRIMPDGSRRNRVGFYINNEITDPVELLTATHAALESASVPHVTYKTKVMDYAKIEGRIYKEVNLGDTVLIIDDDLKLQLKARCLEMKHNLLEKEDTELLLDSFQDVFTAGGGTVTDPSLRLDQLESALGGKIDRGETIETSWLEEEMRLLRERIIAGGGTVTINDEYGILVEEDPIGKTGGAVKLTGGMIALADTFDAAAGTYNWRNFGTGEGWLADLITAGKFSFDQSEGGTLRLGVPYGNGNLEVWVDKDPTQEGYDLIAGINIDGAYFPSLSSEDIKGNVINTWELGTMNFYFDTVNGNDDNDGLSWEAPKRSVADWIRNLPRNLKGVTLTLRQRGTLYGGIEISGFYNGTIWIYGTTDAAGVRAKIYGRNKVFNCFATWVYLSGFDCYGDNTTGGEAVWRMEQVSRMELAGIKVYGNNLAKHGFWIQNGKLNIYDCHCYNVGDRGIYCENSEVQFRNCKGNPPIGMLVSHAGKIVGSGTRWAGSVVRWESAFLGAYNAGGTAWVNDIWTVDYGEAQPPTPPPPPETTISRTATGGDNWSTSGYWENGVVKQGNYGWGNRTGLWYFDLAAIKGKTIVSAKLTTYRNSGGVSGAKLCSLVTHRHASRPSGAPAVSSVQQQFYIDIGQTVTVDVTALLQRQIASGGDTSLGIYDPNGNSQTYMNLRVNSTLSITYK